MTLAADTRDAVRERPFLHDALEAGVLNYSAAARYLDIGEQSAVAAALRRYGEELPDPSSETDCRVQMRTGLGAGEPADAVLVAGDTALVPDAGTLTGILVTGDVSIRLVRQLLGCCEKAEIPVEAAAFEPNTLVMVVERDDGPDTLRLVESVCRS